MSDIFDEVEEGLRQDRLTRAWTRYGWIIYLAGALIIGLVAANEYIRHTTARTIEEDRTGLEAALADFDARAYEKASEALTGIASSQARTAPVAGHYLAGLRMEVNGDESAARDILVNAAGPAETTIAKLALIKAAYLQADHVSRAEIETLLAPLSAEESAFGMLALELVASKALQEGDIDFARRQFTILRLAPNAPPGVRVRAIQALASLLPPQAPDTQNSGDDNNQNNTAPENTEQTENNPDEKAEP